MSDDPLKRPYLDAARLFVWYSGSKFSFHQGKTSNELAKKYHSKMHEAYEIFVKDKYGA